MSDLKVYSLKNCDTCKKALKWLRDQSIGHTNLDIRADGLPGSAIEHIVHAVGWEKALNRRSTTWRGLSEEERENPDNEKAIALIEAHPTLLKRPAFILDEEVRVGFDASTQEWLTNTRRG